MADGVAPEFVHPFKAQLDENSVAVGFDGARAYFHGGGNLFGGLADAQEAVDFLFLPAQFAQHRVGRVARDLLGERDGCAGADEAAAGGNFRNCLHEYPMDFALRDITQCAGGKGLFHMRAIFMHRVDEGYQAAITKILDQDHAILIAQRKVHEYDVRPMVLACGQRLGPAARFRAHGNAFGIEQQTQSLADRGMIVRNQNANRPGIPLSISFHVEPFQCHRFVHSAG